MKHLFPLLLVITIFLPCIASDVSQLVYDSAGNALSSENKYYIFPIDRRFGGGALTIVYAGNARCEHFVFHKSEEALQGTKVRFTVLQNSTVGAVVRLSTDVEIDFVGIVWPCMRPSTWYISSFQPMFPVSPSSSTSKLQYVVANANTEPNHPSSAKVFRIERYGDDARMGYKLVSCSTQGEPCKNLGFHAIENDMFLAEMDEPLAVKFNKA